MKHFLLLGAGFSRNWGGWLASEAFEYLLGCDQIRRNKSLKDRLWRCQPNGGFEAALGELQEAWLQELQEKQTSTEYHSKVFEDMSGLLTALESMFKDMNSAFDDLKSLEFQSEKRLVSDFLGKFDSIFTLNQDLLFEKKYRMASHLFETNQKWQSWHIPGMREASYKSGYDETTSKMIPEQVHAFKVDEQKQPYYKLHGSSNWRDGGDRDLLILGGNKGSAIQSRKILTWYYSQFCNELSAKGPARLMVIGYGFRDDHINKAILNGAQKGLEIFIIDPRGTDVLITNDAFELRPAIAGASRRNMREIFGDMTNVEYHKVMRFLN